MISYIYLFDRFIFLVIEGESMAVPFSKSKRDEIAEKLKEGARIFASQKGMKKTSVDSLVEYAGISKGAFYNFYGSKDELFLEVVEDWHTDIYGMALDCILEKNGQSNANRAVKAVYEACRMMAENGIMRFIKNDLPQLLDSINGSELMERYHGDDIHIKEVIKYSGISLLITDDEAVDIIKNLAFCVLNSGTDSFWHAYKIIVNSVCKYIVK